MKRSANQAARSLGLHPANLMLYLAEMGASFEDVWPEVDDCWIEAVKATDWHKFAGRKPALVPPPEGVPEAHPPSELEVSSDAGLVLEKLWRHSKWGDVSIGREGIEKLTHTHAERLDGAIQELLKRDLLLSQGRFGPYSLNPSKGSEVERIAKAMLSKTL